MPDRPQDPTLATILSDHAQRLRMVERLGSAEGLVVAGGQCMDAHGVGTAADPLILQPRVDPDPANQLACSSDGLFVGGGQSVGWDAVVDGTIVASDPDARLFQGIGEALTYLDGLGLESANVFVRNNHTNYSGSGNLAYTETANWNSPSAVFLFGARGGQGSVGATQQQTGISWNIGAFRPIVAGAAFTPPDYYVHNFAEWSIGAISTANAFRAIHLYDTRLASAVAWATPLCQDFVAIESSLDFINSRTLASNVCYLTQCDVALRATSGANATHVLGGNVLNVTNSALFDGHAGGGTRTLALPDRVEMEIRSATSLENFSGIGAGGSLLLSVPALCQGYIRCTDVVGTSFYRISGTAGVDKLTLEGNYGSISLTGGAQALRLDVSCSSLTIGAPSAGASAHQIRAQCDGTIAITGPANVDITQESNASTVTFTTAVSGTLTGLGYTGAGTWLTINSGGSVLDVVSGGGLAGAGARPYLLAVGSLHNFIQWPNVPGSWPLPGVDSGTNNRVETTPGPGGGAAPANADYLVGTAQAGLSAEIVVGTTPGGELGGTWASPTVDGTHSGSAHADFIAKAFVDAKGDIISASADNTPVILTVGTNNFVLVADSSTASGLAWKNVTDLLNPTAGWGSITNVSTDRAYDADATSIDELADVLGTLVADLVAQGILDA